MDTANIRPILFNSEMVQAIIAGKKTQTRREIKLSKSDANSWELLNYEMSIDARDVPKGFQIFYNDVFDGDIDRWRYYDNIACPYGKAGDILYVRESFYAYGFWQYISTRFKFIDDTLQEKNGIYQYCDNPPAETSKAYMPAKHNWYLRPSIFMPKSACRLFLRIKNVRAEHVMDISEADSKAEGVEIYDQEGDQVFYKNYEKNKDFVYQAKESFLTLWEKTTGLHPALKNSWVWAIDFEVITDPDVLNHLSKTWQL